ncbi:hypothetical protein DL98DRAFT_527088 [Cadophora sp. DSE1049]|nr:hypothetical protein DL98DRAFT_527088 [Cadophora sp. DSE1049]
MAENLVGAGSKLFVPDEDHTHASRAFDRPFRQNRSPQGTAPGTHELCFDMKSSNRNESVKHDLRIYAMLFKGHDKSKQIIERDGLALRGKHSAMSQAQDRTLTLPAHWEMTAVSDLRPSNEWRKKWLTARASSAVSRRIDRDEIGRSIRASLTIQNRRDLAERHEAPTSISKASIVIHEASVVRGAEFQQMTVKTNRDP